MEGSEFVKSDTCDCCELPEVDCLCLKTLGARVPSHDNLQRRRYAEALAGNAAVFARWLANTNDPRTYADFCFREADIFMAEQSRCEEKGRS